MIKRRLMYDGDGIGDERRINILMKTFLKWAKGNDQENDSVTQSRMLAQIAQCELAMRKSVLNSAMMKQEMQMYDDISNKIEGDIILAKEQIEESKKYLEVAKQIRKNRMQYDVLAKVIKEQPDPEKTTEEREILTKELEELEKQRQLLDMKLESKRREYSVLMRSIEELKNEDSNDDFSSSNSSNPSPSPDDVMIIS